MDELIDILDSEGNFTGKTALKSEAHAQGLFHHTAHIWCYTDDGFILLQQRGKHKETYPLKWDVSVAGHIGAGEGIETGAVREVEEESGVQISIYDLEKIGVFKVEKRHSNLIFDREFNHTYLCLLDKNMALKKQESEVEALEWLSLKKFKKWVTTGYQDLVPDDTDRYELIINEIRSRI